MEFFDKLSESLVSAGKDVSQKAKDVSEIAKLKLDIKSKEDYVQKQYEELGRSYYEKHKDEEEGEDAEQFFLIREAVEEIERMKAEVLRIQGSAECPKCGAKMPEGAVYCSNCGTASAMMTISIIWVTDASVRSENCYRTSTVSVFPDWREWSVRE